MKIYTFFVSAAAWQVFLILTLPVILSLFFANVTKSAVVFQVGTLISLWAFLLWIHSACTTMLKKYRAYLKVPAKFYTICIVYLVCYSAVFSLGIVNLKRIAVFQWISFGCDIYILYFFSRLLVMVERKTKVGIDAYIGTILWTWFYIIGIWKIQPRIRRVCLAENGNQPPS